MTTDRIPQPKKTAKGYSVSVAAIPLLALGCARAATPCPQCPECPEAPALKLNPVPPSETEPVQPPSDDTLHVFTLYTDLGSRGGRIHWATFDARDHQGENEAHCRLGAELFQKDYPAARFWCEQGRFRQALDSGRGERTPASGAAAPKGELSIPYDVHLGPDDWREATVKRAAACDEDCRRTHSMKDKPGEFVACHKSCTSNLERCWKRAEWKTTRGDCENWIRNRRTVEESLQR